MFTYEYEEKMVDGVLRVDERLIRDDGRVRVRVHPMGPTPFRHFTYNSELIEFRFTAEDGYLSQNQSNTWKINKQHFQIDFETAWSKRYGSTSAPEDVLEVVMKDVSEALPAYGRNKDGHGGGQIVRFVG